MAGDHKQQPWSSILPPHPQTCRHPSASRFRFARQDGVCTGGHIQHMENEGMPSCVPVLARFCPEAYQCLIHFHLHHPLMACQRMPLLFDRVGWVGFAPVVENRIHTLLWHVWRFWFLVFSIAVKCIPLGVSKHEPATNPFYNNPSLSRNSAMMAESSGGVVCLPLRSISISRASTISFPSLVLMACNAVLPFSIGSFWLGQSR